MADWLKDQGIDFVVTSDKEGPGSAFSKHVVDADVMVTTPFHPVSGLSWAQFVPRGQCDNLVIPRRTCRARSWTRRRI
jgi:hypothetical protein